MSLPGYVFPAFWLISDLSILEVIHKQVRGFQQNRTVNTPWRQEVEAKTQ